jgi:hypothetical protein
MIPLDQIGEMKEISNIKVLIAASDKIPSDHFDLTGAPVPGALAAAQPEIVATAIMASITKTKTFTFFIRQDLRVDFTRA